MARNGPGAGVFGREAMPNPSLRAFGVLRGETSVFPARHRRTLAESDPAGRLVGGLDAGRSGWHG